ncbi:MAG: anaerobic ribonucleoside-triphosphate reductase [Anaeroplasmataceae bacterium]
MKVLKRNGERVEFDQVKIVNAITKANDEMTNESDKISSRKIKSIVEEIVSEVEEMGRPPSVEDIQDKVEQKLMKVKAFVLAKTYITYRFQRALDRQGNNLDKKIMTIADGLDQEALEENANKNPKIAPVQRDYFAGEISKDITRRILLPKHIRNAHDEGIIHFHDTDYFISHIHNCCLINLEDMLQNGTVISKTKIDRPNEFTTACNIATQVIAQVASNQYGGSTISLAHLAPFVDITRKKIEKRYHDNEQNILDGMSKTPIAKVQYNHMIKKNKAYIKTREENIEKEVLKQIEKGIQMLQYQVVTLMTTNGQTPFISFSMYLNEAKNDREKEDLVLIFEEVLRQRMEGIKNEVGQWITPAFPKLLYVLQEDNARKGTKYFDLTELAAKCTAKRMVPDYISEKKMKELKEGNCYPCMGSVGPNEVITYKLNGQLFVTSFDDLWKLLDIKGCQSKPQPENVGDFFIDLTDVDITIYDNKLNKFVECSCISKNKAYKWVRVMFDDKSLLVTHDHKFTTTNRGEVRALDLKSGDTILQLTNQYHEENVERDIETSYAGGEIAEEWCLTNSSIFEYKREHKLAYIAGEIDRYGRINDSGYLTIGSFNKDATTKFSKLLNCVGVDPLCEKITKENGKNWYSVVFNTTDAINSYIKKEEMKKAINLTEIDPETRDVSVISVDSIVTEFSEKLPVWSYDLTTKSEHFEVSGVYTHNCRSFLNVWKNEFDEYKFYGRFNKGVVTLNLADIALSSGKDESVFWKLFDERLELCYEALMLRYNRLAGTLSDTAPIMWQHGALARLKSGETIDKLLEGGYSSISLGYAGLYECVKYMKNLSHTSEKGKKFAMAVMKHLNDTCTEWNGRKNIGVSAYGTPIESTTYKFMKCLQKRFGIVEGITDKDYITNSYHVNPEEEIDAFEKLAKEAEFQKLSPGGAISYVEIPNMSHNIDGVLSIIEYIYDHIMYAELNTRSDFCHLCDYNGEFDLYKNEDNIHTWKCPSCGNIDLDKMNVVRRVCGYIGSNEMNAGRLDEISKRVLHI